MREILKISLLSISILLIISSCEDRHYQIYDKANVPTYMSFDELRSDIVMEESRNIVQAGKIYFKDEYIYINEYMKGVHVVDISDLTNPENIAFIPVPGNVDMAIKDHILYLDSYTDLVLIDVSDPAHPVEETRMEDILNYTIPEWDYEYPLAQIDEDKGIVTGYELKEYKQQIYTNPHPYPIYWNYGMEDSRMLSSSVSSSGAGSGASYGVAGSTARFLSYDDYLYLLENQNMLKVIDISVLTDPKEVSEKYIGWGLETMFIYDENMYLGAMGGLYIVGLEEPELPYYKSMYRHITSCDPVVVSGNTAYVTLRDGTRCGGNSNLLEVVDISDKYKPSRIASYPMDHPEGLGISGTTLFVCEEDGLQVYNASNPNSIKSNLIASFSDIQVSDVIPVDTLLFSIGEDGLYIYDYSDLGNILQVGSIIIE